MLLYVFPSIQVNEPHAVCTSVPAVGLAIVRSKVTIESHPLTEAPNKVSVAVVLLVVYVFPSIQVNGPHDVCTSIALIAEHTSEKIEKASIAMSELQP